MLFHSAIGDLRERRLDPLVLWVLADNARGRSFYEAMGWHSDGSTRPIDSGGTSVGEVPLPGATRERPRRPMTLGGI